MSTQEPSTFVEWWQNLPIPWLAALANGRKEATANGTVFDEQVSLIKEATKARMPAYAPTDALGLLGGDRGLERGPSESESNFRLRLQDAWNDWARAGTALELLFQLHWAGFKGAVIIQQNGLTFTMAPSVSAINTATGGVITISDPLPGTAVSYDPYSFLVIGSAMPHPQKPGTPPWWSYDGLDYFASRFTVLFPAGGTHFTTSGTATFTEAANTATVTWNNAFPDTTYKTQIGAVYSDSPATVAVDASTKTTTTAGLIASGPFTGTVDVLAWQVGSEPFADPHPNDLARLRRIIRRWKPAKATCTGIVVVERLPVWGWPTTTVWGGAGLKWGVSNSVRFAA